MELPPNPIFKRADDKAAFDSLLVDILKVIQQPADERDGVKVARLGFQANESDGSLGRQLNWRGSYIQQLQEILGSSDYAKPLDEDPKSGIKQVIKKTTTDDVYWIETRHPNTHSVSFELIRDDPKHRQYSKEALQIRGWSVE